MPVYIKVKIETTIKLQDPVDARSIEEAKENLTITSPNELLDEKYEFEVEDAD